MRFVINYPQTQLSIVARKLADWPVALRIACTMLLLGLGLIGVALWLGYRASAPILHDSLESLPLLQAKLHASRMSDVLKDMRHSLERIAQSRTFTAEELRDAMPVFFQDTLAMVRELAFKDSQGNGFLLGPNTVGFEVRSLSEASQGPYSPFQQINTMPLYPGEATVFPVVYHEDSGIGRADAPRTDPLLRMALPLQDGSGVLVLGVSVPELQKHLAKLLAPDSPLRVHVQNGAVQLAFFFDTRGWIIFEVDAFNNKGYVPDTSRLGYTGDLGRAGYDAGFRPWAMHENYWFMVTEAVSQRSGSVPAPADKYTTAHVGATGFLCYAPVLFSPSDTGEPTVLGGIAFFETSSLPLASYMRLANYTLCIMLAACVLLSMAAYRIHRTLIVPFRELSARLAAMYDSGDLSYIHAEPSSEEQQSLQRAVNSIVSTAMTARNTASMLTREIKLAKARLPVDLRSLREEHYLEAEFGLVGSSPQIAKIRELVRKAAKAGTDVLVWGETGTGKELIAAAIHKAGAYSDGPYISLNCGALDENLLLDTLFGHVRGAFTEAKTDRKGAFLSAEGGTLHLDEIGNASLKVQQALLRALSVRRIRPLGTDEEVPFNTRVVAATNEDLRERIRAGTFREDLYYRLAIISIETPSLRRRKADLPELAAFCIHEAAKSLGRPPARLSQGALELMTEYDWPGNVREFKNCITRAMAFAEGDIILRSHITLEQSAHVRPPAPPVGVDTLRPHHRAPTETHAPAEEKKGKKDNGQSAPSSHSEHLHYPMEDFWPSSIRDALASARQRDVHSVPAYTVDEPLRRSREGGPTVYEAEIFAAQSGQGHAHSATYTPPRAGSRSGTDAIVPNVSSPPSLEMTGQDLNERQTLALRYVRIHGEITRAQYESVAGQGVSSRTAQNDLRELVERGILDRQGAGPGTRYILKQAADESSIHAVQASSGRNMTNL